MYPFLERGGEKSEEESGNSIDCYLYGGSVLDRMPGCNKGLRLRDDSEPRAKSEARRSYMER